MDEKTEEVQWRKEDNLIPFNKMSKERQRKIASMGGKKVTENQRVAAWLRSNKREGNLSKGGFEFIANMLQNPDLSIAQIAKFANKHLLENEKLSTKEANMVVNTMIALHKAHHGEKKKEDHTHTVNIINWNDIIEKCGLEMQVEEDNEDKPKEVSE